MGHGVVSQQGDSGGPVYLTSGPGTARIVGIFNSVWGGLPAAVSWQSATQQIRQDVGVGGPAIWRQPSSARRTPVSTAPPHVTGRRRNPESDRRYSP